jgi:predicted nucleic acid-binding protein
VKRFVLDASVALAWFVDHPMPAYAGRVRQVLLSGGRAVVPALWQLEMANGFVVAERHGLLTSTDSIEALGNLEIVFAQAIENSVEPLSMRRVLATAREFRLRAYDAAYLDTARGQQLALATLDRRLMDAAARAHVPLVP